MTLIMWFLPRALPAHSYPFHPHSVAGPGSAPTTVESGAGKPTRNSGIRRCLRDLGLGKEGLPSESLRSSLFFSSMCYMDPSKAEEERMGGRKQVWFCDHAGL